MIQFLDKKYSIFNSDINVDYIRECDEMLKKHLSNIKISSKCNKKLDYVLGAVMGMLLGDSIGSILEFFGVDDRKSKVYVKNEKIVYDLYFGESEHSWTFEEKNKFNLYSPSMQSDDNNICSKNNPEEYNTMKYNINYGIWTDDASNGLCIMDSLLICDKYVGSDIRLRLAGWWFYKYNNYSNYKNKSIGLGTNMKDAINGIHQEKTITFSYYEPLETVNIFNTEHADGNGGMMRLCPIPIRFGNIDDALKYAVHSSATTHRGLGAAICCHFMAFFIHRAIDNTMPLLVIKEFIQTTINDYIDHYINTFFDPIERIFDKEKNNLNSRYLIGLNVVRLIYILINHEYETKYDTDIEHSIKQVVKNNNIIKTIQQCEIVKRLNLSKEEIDGIINELSSNIIYSKIVRKTKVNIINKEKYLNFNWMLYPEADAYRDAIIKSVQMRRQSDDKFSDSLYQYFGSYCMDGLALVLNSLWHTNTFADAIMRTINQLGDCDTTGSICGQMAGAFYGMRNLHKKLSNSNSKALVNYYNNYIKPRAKIPIPYINASADICDDTILVRACMLYNDRISNV